MAGQTDSLDPVSGRHKRSLTGHEGPLAGHFTGRPILPEFGSNATGRFVPEDMPDVSAGTGRSGGNAETMVGDAGIS
jgi:hypothetical protein